MYICLYFLGFCAAQADLHDAIFTENKTRVLFPFLSQVLEQIVAHILHLEHEYIGVLLHTESYIIDDALFPLQALAVGFGQRNCKRKI